MFRPIRLLIATVILLSGLALLPYVGLPAGRFSWKQYAGAYDNDLPYKQYLALVANNGGPGEAPGGVTLYMPLIRR
jgi:hypothetical protein